MVKVSIGVPIYNVEEYLRECLDSIMNQTFEDFEVIMVDDGSPDNSFSICQEYVAKDDRFKLIHQENKGLAGARNTCLKYMHGEYITWIDSDDVVDNNYLERLLEVQAETGADIVRCSKKHIRGNDIFLITNYDRMYKTKEKIIEVSKLDLILDAFDGRLSVVEFWGTLIHRELYKGWFCSQGVTFEDLGNKFKLYLRTNKVVLVPEQLYGYRQGNSSIMKDSTRQKTFLEELNITKDLMHTIEKYIYYMEVANIDVEEEHLHILKYIDFISSYRVTMIGNEEDKQLYLEYINKYKEKLKRYWNI